jgi:hypothetical protein
LKHDHRTISLLVSGFQDKGANWKDQQLYYFSTPTGIRCQGDGGLFRVVWPDGVLSADHYNLARVKQHCRDLARAIYPRERSASSGRSDGNIAGAFDCNVAGATGKAAHSLSRGPTPEVPQQHKTSRTARQTSEATVPPSRNRRRRFFKEPWDPFGGLRDDRARAKRHGNLWSQTETGQSSPRLKWSDKFP